MERVKPMKRLPMATARLFRAPLSSSRLPVGTRGPAGRLPFFWLALMLAIVLLVSLVLSGCSRHDLPAGGAPPGTLPPGAEASQPSVDFVVLIDNSASITPPEQVIIREATMLLADLADPGDHIAVVTFGEAPKGKTVISRRLVTDADRDAFKAAVKGEVDFREKFSDIRAGIRHLADARDELLPTRDAIRAAVLFSDGKLEPKDRQTAAAFAQMQTDLRGPLAGLPIYAVVLGDTSSRQPIPGLPDLTGLTLMSGHLASSPTHFYHARTLEQLPEIAVTILNDTKGISTLGEDGGAAFRVDSTVELMNLIVRKRSPGSSPGSKGDAELPTSAQIELVPPAITAIPGEASPADAPDSVYRNRDYQHFDLFVVRKPRPGIWTVKCTDGKTPRVLSKIVSPVKLREHIPPQIAVNEAGLLQAWLYDERSKRRITDGYQLQAKIAEVGALDVSLVQVPLTDDEKSGVHSLVLPEGPFTALGKAPAPGRVELQVIATKDGDPWFLRRSPPRTLEVQEPLMEWRTLPTPLRPIPFVTKDLVLGGSIAKARYQDLGFETPATLRILLERRDPATGTYSPVLEQQVPGTAVGDRLEFLVSTPVPDYADYRYSYTLTGRLGTGEFRMQSQTEYFRVEPPWVLVGLAALVFLALLELVSVLTAKVRGQVQLDKTGRNPGYAAVRVSPRREWLSTAVPTAEVDLGTTRVRIRPRRHLFLFKRLCVSVTRGSDVRLDSSPISGTAYICVKARGQHSLRFNLADGDSVDATLRLRV